MWISFVSLALTLLLGQTKDLVFHKVTLKYDVSLAGTVIAKQVPAEPLEGLDWEGPAHLAFAFQDSYASRRTPASYLETPEIRIYRIADFRRALPQTGDTLRQLRSLLSYDGKHYLIARFPVFVSETESDQWIKSYEQILTRDLREESAEYKRYISAVIGSLETRDEEHFDPPLALLDGVLQSIDVSHMRF
jgi:hypothetical protein